MVNKFLKKNNGKGMLLQIRLLDDNESKEKGLKSGIHGLDDIPLFLVKLRAFHPRGVKLITFYCCLEWD